MKRQIRGTSTPAVLFEDKSFTMSLTNSSETGLKGDVAGNFIVTFDIFNIAI